MVKNVVHLTTVIPPTPATWTPNKPPATKISEPISRALLPVGPAYLAHARRVIGNKTFEQDDRDEYAKRVKDTNPHKEDIGIVNDLGIGDEPESPDLLLHDPKDWKNQDHYKVLGLSKFRINATIDQIRIAHRKKVLKHHPDKKAGSGNTDDDAFFKCIQKAFEILSNPERRRQFDSVDPYYIAIESNPPSASEITASAESFYKILAPLFELESRFARALPAPPLGKHDASRQEVEAFYDYWYNFDSWRSFEYRDKEVNEGSDSRDDKRYTERKNKSERARLKKEDSTRVRELVDLALSCDPRIKRIKQEEKEAREAKKKGVVGGKNGKSPAARKEEEERKAEEEKRKKEEEEVARNEAKKAKAAAANAAKKARRAARAAEEEAAKANSSGA